MQKRIFWGSFGAILLVSGMVVTAMGVFGEVRPTVPLVAGVAVVLVLLPAILSAALARFIAARATEYPELKPLVERLEQQDRRIERQDEEIRALTATYEEQNAMRRDFTANVSHELKTPLTSVSGYAELMKDGLVQPEDVPRFAGKIYDESRRMITLVGDIIKLSQLDGKEVAVKIEPIDLYDTCAAVISHLELAAEKKQVTFSLSGEHLVINSAEQIVEELIFNLCDNAVKYNRPGGRVELVLQQCVDGAELTVRDTGIGIAPEDLPHIFERFYRADKTRSREIGGTGLGLSIVKHSAMFLGATLSVDSTPGEGTTVRILF